MPSIWSEYIPIGTLHLDGLDDELTLHESSAIWRRFGSAGSNPKGEAKTSVDDTLADSNPSLPESVQNGFFKHGLLQPLRPLFTQRWIDLEFVAIPSQPGEGLVRVHVLPDDRCRQAVDRSDAKLRKTRNKLVGLLDKSAVAWSGRLAQAENEGLERRPSPVVVDHDSAEQPSLLHLFNTIPSPNPELEGVKDAEAREVMVTLLEGHVQGLKTELYPYQRRSAATMVRRENEPGKVLDPRLDQHKDQEGRPWYHDPISGSLLRDPHHYDGITGGILAEQMGAGKTLICLSLVLASRRLPISPPEIYPVSLPPVRKRIGSLMRMAASCATRHGIPWRYYLEASEGGTPDAAYASCIRELEKEPGYYFKPTPPGPSMRLTRKSLREGPLELLQELPPTKIYLSTASLVIVPANLLQQWQQEIRKHTEGLRVFTVARNDSIPSARELVDADIILFSQPRFERILADDLNGFPQHIKVIHFKRCIIDEGHKLGNSKIGAKSNLLLALDELHIGHRWVVTGTPSRGLYGVEDGDLSQLAQQPLRSDAEAPKQEKADLDRIGSMARLYLKARPWANTALESGDTVADWNTYVALRQRGRSSALQDTLNSLIIRHRLSDVSTMLPRVSEKIVRLEGSYQDRLSLNVFNMMIVLNAVQSQRTDQDYFFHPRQRKFLVELVRNMRQATFFGGLFFPEKDVAKSLQMAREFLLTKVESLGISAQDVDMLEEASAVGDLAVQNELRRLGSLFHEIPLIVSGLPDDAGSAWSLDGEASSNGLACTSATLMHTLQRSVRDSLKNVTALNTFLNGKMVQKGNEERKRITKPPGTKASAQNGDANEANEARVLAGATTVGTSEGPRKARGWSVSKPSEGPALSLDAEDSVPLPDSFKKASVVATASAKLSYLLDAITTHQASEQIMVFYDDENIAWFLASALDVLEVKYLIYAKSLSVERRAQYVDSFIQNPEFRVLLMDIGQAAFGLDIRVASRIYFVNPVLNPQVEAQAIGRARRVSQQQSKVTVETLVLRDSIDELIVERRARMSALEHRQCKTVLDDRPIANWIKNVRIVPMPDLRAAPAEAAGSDHDGRGGALGALPENPGRYYGEMQPLHQPKALFGQAFAAREENPDDGLVERYQFAAGADDTSGRTSAKRPMPAPDDGHGPPGGGAAGGGRVADPDRDPQSQSPVGEDAAVTDGSGSPLPEPKRRRIAFAD